MRSLANSSHPVKVSKVRERTGGSVTILNKRPGEVPSLIAHGANQTASPSPQLVAADPFASISTSTRECDLLLIPSITGYKLWCFVCLSVCISSFVFIACVLLV